MKKKLFLYFGLVFVVGMMISSFLSFSVIKNEIDQNTKKHMITDVELVSKILEMERKYGVNDYSYVLSDKIRKVTEARFTLIEQNGTVDYDSETDYKTMGNHSDRPEVIAALKGEIGISTRYSKTIGTDFLYVAKAIPSETGSSLVVRLSMPLTNLKELIGKTEQELLSALLIGLLISLAMGFTVAVYISKPLKKLTETANNIANGDFSDRLYYRGKDEIKNLSVSFNEMAEKLGETVGELNHRNANMSSILENVMNGIIAVDKEERVLFMNRAAAEYLGMETPGDEGQIALKAIRDNGLDEFIKFLMSHQQLTIEEMKFSRNENRQFIVNGNPMFAKGETEPYGYIIVIHDITEIKRLERIRTDFVANVSHELKTPLTSIKGFAETLKSGDIEDKETIDSFLEIIYEEAERLQGLINDILLLSEIESKKIAYDEAFNLSQGIEEVVFMLENQATEKGQSLTFINEAPEAALVSNKNKFKQMLINLMENAIKYTPENGRIESTLSEENGEWKITIKDNGIGIPPESLSRIFERFYRVDKARSRELGGTGLGLSIVKHIVQTMNGRISVESELGKGTIFTIRLPKKE